MQERENAKNTANKTPVAAGQAQEDNDQRSQKVSQKNKENTAKNKVKR
ncbi:hypothetical protein KEH51_13025 [[Brevibacterium] frigoritolerans]|uniref:Uncharacterized protein n=1 Tax=Peribacillus frigoritolerans TaxID=450367 RepID=A0A941J7R5_9BACI|nr:hypothetical protein [Peribacillus frigoritolerans]